MILDIFGKQVTITFNHYSREGEGKKWGEKEGQW